MKQPLESVIRHLQIAFTPAEYHAVTQQYQRAGEFSKTKAQDDYWGRIPSYLIARCPFCNATYFEKLDTHGLSGWAAYPGFWDFVYTSGQEAIDQAEVDKRLGEIEKGIDDPSGYWKSSFEKVSQRTKCLHFVAVQFFINLNGETPEEEYFSNESEVPYVMPVFLPEDIESYAVMHCLPICRVEQGQFVPRYSLYLLTYYAAAAHTLWERRHLESTGGDAFHLPTLHTWRTIELHNLSDAWELSLWVKRGALMWLDLTQDGLPLTSEPANAFPYANIQGIRKSHVYRKGKLEIDPY